MSSEEKQVPSTSGCIEEKAVKEPDAMKRRKFLLHTAAGIAAGLLTGPFLWRSGSEDATREKSDAYPPANATPVKPKVKEGVQMFKRGNYYVFEQRSQKDNVLGCRCTVNKSGADIFQHLNGSHTIEEIAALVSGDGGCAANATAAVCAEIAQFVAELGSIGFLVRPYYAHIYETYA